MKIHIIFNKTTTIGIFNYWNKKYIIINILIIINIYYIFYKIWNKNNNYNNVNNNNNKNNYNKKLKLKLKKLIIFFLKMVNFIKLITK